MSAVSVAPLRPSIVRIVCDSAEGDLTESVLAEAGGSLPAVGYSSLATIRMIDAIENELGVYLEPEEPRLSTLDGIVELVAERLPDVAPA
jgi:acyl carrier protein